MVSNIESGTLKYMSQYPEESTDGIIRLGNRVPDFSCDTTCGKWESFHEWKKDKWAILFSHPGDFTAVSTTEVVSLAEKCKQISDLGFQVVVLSADKINRHSAWIEDIEYLTEDILDVDFPIIDDHSREIATRFGMLDSWGFEKDKLPLTIRSVFFVNPENRLMMSLNYPDCVGINTSEIIRCAQALQLSYQKSIAAPANWPKNHAEVRLPDGTKSGDFRGGVFVLPTVTDDDAVTNYPNHHVLEVPSNKKYLRLVKSDDIGFAVKARRSSGIERGESERVAGGGAERRTSGTRASSSKPPSGQKDKRRSSKELMMEWFDKH